ncbi:sucrose transport protein, putative [Talaromyces stipitatus ATCC 10500]|uniref:Sucrose transport protein, putative n=1 Tax=Talaromyces stipitatus (strain ATCC 10500 / CBS 375.48 / QM 6759 / NRRL 1006) TaxID=441959 RepID=B8MG32_TALSN|nr:sucrose transport protein, putative [Talaromyces stipitatus ATCC 10500]EED15899.1 sucrose transport protein, putative [Talaromyces stipitatus ATCC 10500]
MSKALLAWVWVAGPLTGTVVQPYIGIRSDNCRGHWGRRKPFIAIGGATTVICLLALAWVQELTGSVFAIFNADVKSDTVKSVSIVAAIVLMYCHDFGINTVQAAMRAYIVDNAPSHQQKSANAWASRVSEAASIICYAFGYMDLPKIFPVLGKTQFQVISVLGSCCLIGSLLISCVFIDDLRTYDRPRTELTTKNSLSMIWKSARYLPPQIRKVFAIQCASWFGWFPFLFYITTYIGQLYVNPIFEKHPDLSNGEVDNIWGDATRIATSAYFLNAVTAFVGSLVLPLLVVAPSPKEFEALSNTNSASDLPQRASVLTTFMQSSTRMLGKLRVPGLTLRRLWLLSHFLFAICMFSTFLISSPGTAAVMTAIVGIPWMITSWAPYAFIATELAQSQSQSTNGEFIAESIHRPGYPYNEFEDTDGIGGAGVVLGLHNVFISFPQMVSSLLSSVIFKALQKPRGEPFDNSVAWFMRFGGCAALIAGILTVPLQDRAAG